jgi:hypothetical protein
MPSQGEHFAGGGEFLPWSRCAFAAVSRSNLLKTEYWHSGCNPLRPTRHSTFSNLKGRENMRKVLALCGLVAVCCTLALADNFSGKLLDSSCVVQNKSPKGCAATATTTSFMLQSGGTIYKLDSAGNAKAAEAMKSRADRSATPSQPSAAGVNARVTATKGSDDTLKVEVIEIQ